MNFPSWRHDVARVFAQFILQDIPDSCPMVLEAAMKMLIQMITHWKALITDKQVRTCLYTSKGDVSTCMYVITVVNLPYLGFNTNSWRQ